MKVAVTGATGFVGSALVRALLAQGDEVTAVVRPTSDRWRLAEQYDQINWAEGDILHPAQLDTAFAGADAVIHAAGQLGEAGIPGDYYRAIHIDGTRHVLQAALAAQVRRVLYVSSPGVLGPIPKDAPPATELMPLAPSNLYERSKASAEEVAREFAARGLAVVIVRPEFIYGPWDTHVLGLFAAVQKGLFFTVGQGEALCHPTFIRDAARGMLAALAKGAGDRVYHICGPRPVTFAELGDTIADGLGVKRPWLKMPQPLAYAGAAVLETAGAFAHFTPPLSRSGVAFFSESRHFSTARAQAELGFTPEVDIAAGVAETIAWYRATGRL
jgi:nucleoside-diphosphate-sugar epimerase